MTTKVRALPARFGRVLGDRRSSRTEVRLLQAPDGFNVDLLFAISEARRRAQEDNDDPHQEDRVLVAQTWDGDWMWREFPPLRELSRKPEPVLGSPSAPVVLTGPAWDEARM
ncbi:hypothetical protein Shyd_84600 [Streptomyces hydrogenans]|uniref:Uncharacterized protein n=1 Tax=Streptomyces hydrogenans TaxID=1873719 RepID=A0ABQ3PPY4_9ACTN|nr:hypothetical protein Shyd_84600 [Streptomyces hydrogenans]